MFVIIYSIIFIIRAVKLIQVIYEYKICHNGWILFWQLFGVSFMIVFFFIIDWKALP